jgi:hypothetical protein
LEPELLEEPPILLENLLFFFARCETLIAINTISSSSNMSSGTSSEASSSESITLAFRAFEELLV